MLAGGRVRSRVGATFTIPQSLAYEHAVLVANCATLCAPPVKEIGKVLVLLQCRDKLFHQRVQQTARSHVLRVHTRITNLLFGIVEITLYASAATLTHVRFFGIRVRL